MKERPRLRSAFPDTVSTEEPVHARGWDYRNRGRANWSMTNAGLSSLILVRRNIGRSLRPQERAALDGAIRDGYGWVTTRWSGLRSHYGAYSLEKVGDLGGVQLFGKHDWFQELSMGLVATQGADGGWTGGKAHGDIPRVATSFALLVLNRASSRLTRDSGAHIVLSGKQDAKQGRSWVYVEKVDASVHVPTLLRQIRLRPRLAAVKLLEKIVDSYPLDQRGELVPGLTRLHERCQHGKVRRLVSACLVEITGCRQRDVEAHVAWHRKWAKAVELGGQASPSSVTELLTLYRGAGNNRSLKEKVIWALGRCRARAAVSLLLEDLGHSHERVRRAAYRAIRSLFTELPPPFDESARSSTRAKQAAEVRRWCSERKGRSG